MAQLTVRNLEDDVKNRLKIRAARNGRSMEDEIRLILRNAVKDVDRVQPKLGSRISRRFAKIGLDEALPELHGDGVRPAQFDQ